MGGMGGWPHERSEWLRPDSGRPHVPYAWIADMLRAYGAKGKDTMLPCARPVAGFLGWLHALMRFDGAIPGCVANNCWDVAWSEIGNRAD